MYSLRTVQHVNAEIRQTLMKNNEHLNYEKAYDMETGHPLEDESHSQNFQTENEAEVIPAADNRLDNIFNLTLRNSNRKWPVMDCFEKRAICRHIVDRYSKKKVLSVGKLNVSLHDADLFTGRKSSLPLSLIHI